MLDKNGKLFGKINIIDDYTSKVFKNDDMVDRCVYSGDYVYLIGTHDSYNSHDYPTIDIEAVKYR